MVCNLDLEVDFLVLFVKNNDSDCKYVWGNSLTVPCWYIKAELIDMVSSGNNIVWNGKKFGVNTESC